MPFRQQIVFFFFAKLVFQGTKRQRDIFERSEWALYTLVALLSSSIKFVLRWRQAYAD